MGKPVKVRNPDGLVSWVGEEQAKKLLTLPGWERVEDAPKPKRKARPKGGK